MGTGVKAWIKHERSRHSMMPRGRSGKAATRMPSRWRVLRSQKPVGSLRNGWFLHSAPSTTRQQAMSEPQPRITYSIES